MGSDALILAWTMATFQLTATKDPCALLTVAEIQSLAPAAKIGPGKAAAMPGGLGSVSCDYTWGPGGNVASGKSYLHVVLSDASRMFPGMSAETIKEGLLADVKKPGANASEIAGIGEAAVFKSDDPIRAGATASVRGHVLEVTFESADARTKKDQVIALLRAATQRL